MPDTDLIAEGRGLAAELESDSWFAHVAATMAERLAALTARDDQPITMDWLDACGVMYESPRGAYRDYRLGTLWLRFVDGELRVPTWLIGPGLIQVRTRQDLRDLLRLMGAGALREPRE